MIRFIIQTILIAILGFLSQYVMGWNGVMVAALVGSLILHNKGVSSFLAGFIAIGALWFLLAYNLDSANQSLLSSKVAALLGLASSMQLVMATALIGGLLGGFSSLTGSLFISILKKEKKSNSPYYE